MDDDAVVTAFKPAYKMGVEMQPACAAEREEKWSARRSIALVVGASLCGWALLIALVYAVGWVLFH